MRNQSDSGSRVRGNDRVVPRVPAAAEQPAPTALQALAAGRPFIGLIAGAAAVTVLLFLTPLRG